MPSLPRSPLSLTQLTTLALLALAPVVSYAQTSVALNVNWRADRKANDAQTYQINTWDAINPSTATNASYLANLTTLKPGMVRVHAYEMYSTTNTAKRWVNTTTQTWDAAKIVQVYTAIRSKSADFMQNIPNWPSWMDVNNDGLLDDGTISGTTDQRQNYANFCASLVKILNVDNNFQVKYWEVLNEKEGLYGWGNAAYAEIYNRCANAMKAIDPTIIVGGPAITQPYPYSSQETALKSWILATKANLGFFSYHNYATGGANPSSDYLYDGAGLIGARATWARGLLTSQGVATTVPVYIGECNIFYDYTLDQSTQYMRGMLGGSFTALVIKAVGENPDARGVQFWNDKDGTFGFMNDSYGLRASGRVLALANEHLVGTSVGVTTADKTQLNLYAVKSTNGTKKAVLLVNTSDVAISGGGSAPGTAYTAALTFSDAWPAPSTSSAYTVYTISALTSDTASLTTTTGSYTGGTLSVSMPANQIKVIVFTDVANNPDQIVRNPEADCYVTSGNPTAPATNSAFLNLYGPSAESFVRYDVSNLGGAITSAKLRLYPTVVNAPAAIHRLDQATNNTWSETAMTWSTKPTTTLAYYPTWTNLVKNVRAEIDVTAAAQAAANATDKKISFRISSQTTGGDNRYGSRETAIETRPELVIIRSAAPVTLGAFADAHVNQSTPTTNYGTSNVIQVKLTGSGADVEGYYQFNLTGLSTTSAATLYLNAVSIDATNRVNWLGLAPNGTWTETTLDWTNKPGSTADIASWTPVTGQDVVINVTSQVQAALASGKVSFRVYSKIAGGYNRYGTKEQTTAGNRPELVVQP